MQNHRTPRLCLLLTTMIVSLGMSCPVMAQDRNFESCPLEVIAQGWQTKTIDNVANGSFGVMLERFDQTWPTWMLSAVRQTMELGLDKKVLDANTGLTVTIDAKNGYAEVSDDGTDGEYATVCYWNRPGGHKLLAVLLGKPTDPSIELLCFYDYDPQRRTLTPEPDIVQECCQPEHGGEMAFQLPRKGTALTVTEYSGGLSYSRIYKWDGRLFTFDHTEVESPEEAAAPMDGGGPDISFPVTFSGQQPTVSDFLTAILSQQDIGEALADVGRNWQLHRQGRQLDKGASFMVDEHNGFIRYDHVYADAGEAAHTEVCYWNCKDGRHKLVGVNMGLLVGGKVTDCQNCGLSFYLYDIDTSKLTIATPYDVGANIQVSPPVSYNLPRMGKNIRACIHSPKKAVNILMKWNGQTFDQEQVE